MRWRALFILADTDTDAETSDTSRDEDNTATTDAYGLKSRCVPPQIPELVSFESDMLEMVENIKFKEVTEKFLSNLKKDIENITSSKEIFVEADKTRNMYKMDPAKYGGLLTVNISQKYKYADRNTATEIDNEYTSLADKLKIGNRINKTGPKTAFVTIKDHKEIFQNNTKCRLINTKKT